MLSLLCRPVASAVRARLLRWAPPLACIGMLAAPLALAAETMAIPTEMGMAASPPFSKYQNWRDEPIQDWSAANARVGEIGGWLTYLREAQQGKGSADPGSQGHQGHHGH